MRSSEELLAVAGGQDSDFETTRLVSGKSSSSSGSGSGGGGWGAGVPDDYSDKVDAVLASRSYQMVAAATCGLGIAAGSTTVMAISLALPLIEEEFTALDWQRSMVASCIFLGMLVGGLASGISGDIYGRRNTS